MDCASIHLLRNRPTARLCQGEQQFEGNVIPV
jgi:hypothetical protein